MITITLVCTIYVPEIKIPQLGFTTLLQPMHMYVHVSCKYVLMYIKWMNEITSQVLWCFTQTKLCNTVLIQRLATTALTKGQEGPSICLDAHQKSSSFSQLSAVEKT